MADRHPPAPSQPAAHRRRLLRWADEADAIATQLHGTVCRLRDRATALRQEAQQ